LELGQSLQMLQPVLHLHFACSGSLGTLHPNRLATHLPPAPLSLPLLDFASDYSTTAGEIWAAER
jgi:hypothetical protein